MVRPGSVLEVGQLVGPVSGLYIMCVGKEVAENESKHSKSQLKISGMDGLINHKYHVYFIDTGVNSEDSNGHTYHVNINCS